MEEAKQDDRITQYERAICYYALPRMINPVTLGLLIAYAVCLAEAVAALAYGILANNDTWATAGAAAFIGLVVFGLIVFTGRALLNAVRERRLLAAARGVPEPLAEAADTPDPFAGHVLLRHPMHHPKRHFDCEAQTDTTRFHVDVGPAGDAWVVTDDQGEEVCTVRVDRWASSFILSPGNPSRLTVCKQAKPFAHIVNRFSLGANLVEVRMLEDNNAACRVQGDAIVQGKEQVGRLYRLRGNLYLDIRSDALNEALLGYFATLT